MYQYMQKTAAGRFSLKKLDIGEFSQIRSRGMNFRVKVFDAEGAGRLCVMKMKAFLGLMKMETAVFSPVGLDGPLFSCDYIEAFGKHTFLIELYDTTLSHPRFEGLEEIKAKYANLPTYDPGTHWYDDLALPASDYKKGKNLRQALEPYMEEYCGKYFELLSACEACDPGEKKKKNAEYADGLLNNGGPAVNQFTKMIGREKTEIFLKRYMFGAE